MSGEPEERAVSATAASAEPVLEARDLVVAFGGRRVLDGVSLSVRRGETLAVLGLSGGGKSTLLKCLIGALEPTAGTVRILGRGLTGADERARNEIRKSFGVLFQSGALFQSLTVGENVALPLRLHTRQRESTIRMLVRMKLELVGLRNAEKLMPSEISGGMKKRVGLARALALEPALVFFDEPHAGLDPITIGVIDKLIVSLGRLGLTSVVVTHELPSAFRIADRVIVLDGGRVAAEGSPDSVRQSDDPLVRQFVEGKPDGPIAFYRSAADYVDELYDLAAVYATRGWSP